MTGEPESTTGRDVRLVVGLGNPGPRYAMTRHNAGFMTADLLADRCGARFSMDLEYSVAARAEIDGVEVWIAKPQCYMNRSGLAVRELLAKCGDAEAGILVAYDDFHLPLGRIRFRPRGSAGGQNGVRSILEVLQRDDFHRLRVGIGEPAENESPADYVLALVPEGDRGPLREALERAVDGAEHWLRSGDVRECMNRYNGLDGTEESSASD